MTRARAIELLSNDAFKLCMVQLRDPLFEECYEALNMAIAALSENKRTENTRKTHACDCIERQAAIDALNTGLWGVEWDKALATAMLKDLPSAQPFTSEQIQTMQELEFAQVEKAYELGKADRPTGHWIETAQEYYEMINEKGGGVDENTPYFTDDIACSECLAKFSVIDNETERFDYCPNCGARME